MKKYILIVASLLLLYVGWDYAYYHLGIYIDFGEEKEVNTFVKTDGTAICMYDETAGTYLPFEIKGVNMGSGEPGEWSTDFHIDKETYKRWFAQIQELGANTIRVYTIQADDFYLAFYEYNSQREEEGKVPLWLLHGVWVNDYVQNSARDAYDDDFLKTFLNDCRTMINVIHGKQKISLGRIASAGSGTYTHDVSRWVIGYILGVEWEDVTVAYTDHKYEGLEGYTSYTGEYLRTTPEATPFECMLAQVGDTVIAYETKRFGTQKLLAFANWPTTDPFDYGPDIQRFFEKCAKVDVEHIQATEAFLAGQFASYHVYPYYPDYLQYESDWTVFGIDQRSNYDTKNGELNTYRAYLDMLTRHHQMPVVISEFGVSTGRGMAQIDANTNRNQGHMSESEQGEALILCWEDIQAAGCAGGCVFAWQDEWFKRTWNTMYAVDLKRTPYWSDYQTNEQYFGLLSFDPGKEESICYVDGDVSEWTAKDVVSENHGMKLSMKYDEKFIYFLVEKENLDFEDVNIYIPVDITPKSGSTYCAEHDIAFDRAVDFLIVINGKEDSRVLVQERYEALRANYAENIYGFDTYIKGNEPDANSSYFAKIDMILKLDTVSESYLEKGGTAQTFETGLLKYGNANPASSDFDSLADFISEGNYIEIKIPWQLFNFADPSRMEIHDDYYDGNYGVAYINIDKMYVGIGDETDRGNPASLAASRISLAPYPLEGWGNKVTYHERLKSSYYELQEIWREQ